MSIDLIEWYKPTNREGFSRTYIYYCQTLTLVNMRLRFLPAHPPHTHHYWAWCIYNMAGGPFNNYRIGSNTILKMSDEGPATLVYSILVISLINVGSPISCKKTIKFYQHMSGKQWKAERELIYGFHQQFFSFLHYWKQLLITRECYDTL